MNKLIGRIPAPALAYEEEMTGELSFIENPLELRPVELQVRIVLDSVAKLADQPIARVEGTIDIEGLADNRPIEGIVAYRFDERRVPYSFSFTTDDGRKLSFRAQKDFSIFRVGEFIGHLDGTLYEEGPRELARLALRRPVLRGITSFIKSLRLKF